MVYLDFKISNILQILGISAVFTAFTPLISTTYAFKAFESSNQLVAYGDYSSVELNNIDFNKTDSSRLSWITSYSSVFEGAEINPGGEIRAGCRIREGRNEWVVVGGRFSSLGFQTAGNIAAVNMNGKVDIMNGGLNGSVNGLFCDNSTDTVYAYGVFTSTVFPQQIHPVKPTFINIAKYEFGSQVWKSLSFVGLNGQVNAVSRSADGKFLWVAGQFNSTADGTYDNGYIAHPINLSEAKITTINGTDDKNYINPFNMVCNDELDSSQINWASKPDSSSSILIEFNTNVNVSMISLSNFHKPDLGTKSVIFSYKKNSVLYPLKMFYYNKTSNAMETCTTCYLDESSSQIQDFLVSSVKEVDNIVLNITEWYGNYGGLSVLSIYQKNSVVHPNDKLNLSKCNTLNFKMHQVQKSGTWVEKYTQDTGMSFLEAEPRDQYNPETDTARYIILQPLIVTSAYYDVYIDIPSCTDAEECAKRGIAQAAFKFFANDETTLSTKSLNQTATTDQSILIYSGYIPKTTKDISVAATISFALDSKTREMETTKALVVGSLKVIRKSSFTDLPNMIKLDLKPDLFNSSTRLFEKPEFQLNATTPILSIAPYGNGVFFSVGSKNSTSQIQYYSPSIKFDSAGLVVPGKVSSIRAFDDTLYFGGQFNSNNTQDKSIKGLARIQLDPITGNNASNFEVLDDFNGSVTSFLQKDNISFKKEYLAFFATLNQTSRLINPLSDSIIGLYDTTNSRWLNPVLLSKKPTMAALNSTEIVVAGESFEKLAFLSESVSVFNDFYSQRNNKMSLRNRLAFFANSSTFTANTDTTKTEISSSVTYNDYEIVGGFFQREGGIKNIAMFDSSKNNFFGFELNNQISFGVVDEVKKFGRVNELVLSEEMLVIIGVQSKLVSGKQSDANETVKLDTKKSLNSREGIPVLTDPPTPFQGFTIYDLAKNKIIYNLDKVEQDNSQNNSSVVEFKNVLVGFDQHGFIVSGNFSPNTMDGCQNLCEFKLGKNIWSNIGDNLVTGQINSMFNYDDKIYLGGDLTIKGLDTNEYMVQLDFKRNGGFLVNQIKTSDFILGPILYMNQHEDSMLYIMGYSKGKNSKPYFVGYDGSAFQNFEIPNVTINALTGLSVINHKQQDRGYISAPVLLGNFKFTGLDGENASYNAIISLNNTWYPYMKAINSDGSLGLLRDLRNSDRPSTIYKIKPPVLIRYLFVLIFSICLFIALTVFMSLISSQRSLRKADHDFSESRPHSPIYSRREDSLGDLPVSGLSPYIDENNIASTSNNTIHDSDYSADRDFQAQDSMDRLNPQIYDSTARSIKISEQNAASFGLGPGCELNEEFKKELANSYRKEFSVENKTDPNAKILNIQDRGKSSLAPDQLVLSPSDIMTPDPQLASSMFPQTAQNMGNADDSFLNLSDSSSISQSTSSHPHTDYHHAAHMRSSRFSESDSYNLQDQSHINQELSQQKSFVGKSPERKVSKTEKKSNAAAIDYSCLHQGDITTSTDSEMAESISNQGKTAAAYSLDSLGNVNTANSLGNVDSAETSNVHKVDNETNTGDNTEKDYNHHTMDRIDVADVAFTDNSFDTENQLGKAGQTCDVEEIETDTIANSPPTGFAPKPHLNVNGSKTSLDPSKEQAFGYYKHLDSEKSSADNFTSNGESFANKQEPAVISSSDSVNMPRTVREEKKVLRSYQMGREKTRSVKRASNVYSSDKSSIKSMKFKVASKPSQDSFVGKHVNMFENYERNKPIVKSWRNSGTSFASVGKTRQKIRNMASGTDSEQNYSGKNSSSTSTSKPKSRIKRNYHLSTNVSPLDLQNDKLNTANKKDDGKQSNESEALFPESIPNPEKDSSLPSNFDEYLETSKRGSHVNIPADKISETTPVQAVSKSVSEKPSPIPPQESHTNKQGAQDSSLNKPTDYSKIRKDIRKYMEENEIRDATLDTESFDSELLESDTELDRILRIADKISGADQHVKAKHELSKNTGLDSNDNKSNRLEADSNGTPNPHSIDYTSFESIKERERSKTTDSLNRGSSFQQYPKYVSAFDFKSTQEGELSFNTGETIYVTDTSDTIWWTGLIDRGPGKPVQSGIFPAPYVKKVDN